MSTHRFLQVDVFTAAPLAGNPVAVVLAADDLAPAVMQRIAAWTNLSETTFVLTPTERDADYRVRIFTPRDELPFAGHPTIGTAHAVLEAGVVPAEVRTLRQECGAGLLPLRVEEDAGGARRLYVRVPEPRLARECGDLTDALAGALGGPVLADPAPASIDVGPVWIVAQIADAAVLARLAPDAGVLARLSSERRVTGVTVFAQAADGEGLVVRSFAPAAGVPEDPVCGSGNASVAAFLAFRGRDAGVGPRYVARQGREVGRDGRVEVTIAEGGRSIEIGGSAVTVIEGTLRL